MTEKTNTLEDIAFTDFELARYERQIRLNDFGIEGQKKLKNSTVLVSRVGGVGGTAAMHLARAGVGKLLLVHGGKIVPEYLNRMQLAMSSDVDRPCTDVFVERLKKINPDVITVPVPENINEDNVAGLVSQCDYIVDGAPLFEERYLMNAQAVKQNKIMVSGAMYGLDCSVTTIIPGKTPCFKCLFPEKPDYWTNIKVFPAIGPGPVIVGSMLAMEVIKCIVGIGETLQSQLWHFDLSSNMAKTFRVEKNKACQVCSEI